MGSIKFAFTDRSFYYEFSLHEAHKMNSQYRGRVSRSMNIHRQSANRFLLGRWGAFFFIFSKPDLTIFMRFRLFGPKQYSLKYDLIGCMFFKNLIFIQELSFTQICVTDMAEFLHLMLKIRILQALCI
jgi:hypothetical protein